MAKNNIKHDKKNLIQHHQNEMKQRQPHTKFQEGIPMVWLHQRLQQHVHNSHHKGIGVRDLYKDFCK